MKANAAHIKPQSASRIPLGPISHDIRRSAEMLNLNSLLTVSS
jgi:hypothetical protein